MNILVLKNNIFLLTYSTSYTSDVFTKSSKKGESVEFFMKMKMTASLFYVDKNSKADTK